MSETKPQTSPVDPHDVDWEFIFEASAGGRDGSLGMIERTRAVQNHVPEITSEHTADRLVADALGQGLLVKNGDDIRLADADSTCSDIRADDIDWVSLFNAVVGSPRSKFPTTSRFTHIKIYGPVDSESEAQAAWEDAVEQSIIVKKGQEGSDGPGMYLAEDRLPEVEKEEAVSSDEEDSQEVHEAVSALREDADSESEYVDSMEGLLTDVLDRLERVENYQKRIFEEHNQQRTGITEIQVERLKEGAILSRDGVDEEMLIEDLGFDLIFVGQENDMVRLADRHQVEANEDVSATAMPDFDALCELEEARMKDVLGLATREEIESETKNKYRAMTVWDDAEMLDVSDNDSRIVIPSSKVREKLDRVTDVTGSSLNMAVSRAMEYVRDHSDGVFELEKGNSNKLVANKEDLVDAKISRFEKASIESSDGSANTVVSSREGVSVSGTGR